MARTSESSARPRKRAPLMVSHRAENLVGILRRRGRSCSTATSTDVSAKRLVAIHRPSYRNGGRRSRERSIGAARLQRSGHLVPGPTSRRRASGPSSATGRRRSSHSQLSPRSAGLTARASCGCVGREPPLRRISAWAQGVAQSLQARSLSGDSNEAQDPCRRARSALLVSHRPAPDAGARGLGSLGFPRSMEPERVHEPEVGVEAKAPSVRPAGEAARAVLARMRAKSELVDPVAPSERPHPRCRLRVVSLLPRPHRVRREVRARSGRAAGDGTDGRGMAYARLHRVEHFPFPTRTSTS
jgi:hypothetical protein